MALQLNHAVTDLEFGWLLGILEGEGTFIYGHGTHRITISMGDEDTIHRAIRVMSTLLGKPVAFGEIEPKRSGHSVMYTANITGERARSMMRLVVKHMSYRRRQRIWQCLNLFQPQKIKIDLVELGLAKPKVA